MTIKQNKEPFTCPGCCKVVEFTLARLEKYVKCSSCGRSLTSKEHDEIESHIKARQVARKLDRNGKKEPRRRKKSAGACAGAVAKG
jgi:transcription initiation factor IIE alpha subunit